MATPAQLEKAGITPEKLKKIFSKEKLDTKPQLLLEQISSRIKEGVTRSMRESRLWWAIDRAYDVPFRQTAATLVEGLLAKQIEGKEVVKIAKDWGLAHMLSSVVDRKTGLPTCWPGTRDPMQKLHLPTFIQIFVPLVQAYVKIRWGKLFSDLDQTPLYKYDPLKLTSKNRLKCEIITDRIDVMTQQMGYRMTERDSLFQMLLYGICLNFPMEKWFKEEQLGDDDKPEIIKEGIRFQIPHPSRCFYDLAHRASTLNTDTGCEYSGYWDAVRWRDVKNNEAYFNTDQISYGPNDWIGNYWTAYNELYPCQMSFPDIKSSGAGELDRVNRMVSSLYTQAEDDKAVIIVPYFGKLIPSEWGLGDYDYPVWFRFVLANSATIIYAEPLCYRPTTYYGYDADTNRELNAGLGLELLPWQDMLGNYLSQLLYSIKKNLASATFYNTEIVDEEDIRGINSIGEELYRGFLFIGKSKRELGWQQTAVQEAFQNVVFPKHNIQEIQSGITTMIAMMERTLGFSAQEVGQPAIHEQSATEITTISGNQSVKLDHTRGFAEDGMNARKRSLYDGTMAYSDDEIFAQVGELNDQNRKQLEEMGFKVEEEASQDGRTQAGVRGKKQSLDIDGFSANREGGKRINNIQIATGMVKMFETILAQPLLVQGFGLKQLGEMLNQIFVYLGLPKDFKIMVKEGTDPAQQQQQMQQQLAVISEKIATQVVQKNIGDLVDGLKKSVFEPLQQAIQQMQQAIQTDNTKIADHDQALGKIMQILQSAMGAGPGGPPPPGMPLGPGMPGMVPTPQGPMLLPPGPPPGQVRPPNTYVIQPPMLPLGPTPGGMAQ